jgi:hypothetical protein
MTMNRTIEMYGNHDICLNIAKHCGADKFRNAVGELSTWALGMDSVKKVVITAHFKENESKTEILLISTNMGENYMPLMLITAAWNDEDKAFIFRR